MFGGWANSGVAATHHTRLCQAAAACAISLVGAHHGRHSCTKITHNDSSPSLERSSTQDRARVTTSDGDGTLAAFAPVSPIRIFRPNPHLEIAFDTRTRNPIYVLERLLPRSWEAVSQDPRGGGGRRRHRLNFYEEKSLPEEFRSRNSHYHRSGYDRGHLAPAADFQRWHPDAEDDLDDDADSSSERRSWLKDTYNLCNISPQHPDMNRQIWAQLEQWVRQQVADQQPPDCWTLVVTGPLWLPDRAMASSSSRGASSSSSSSQQLLLSEFSSPSQIAPPHHNVPHNKSAAADYSTGSLTFEYRYPGLGRPPSLVSVPTHFFKVVVVVAPSPDQNQRVDSYRLEKMACFVVPNQAPRFRSAAAGSNEASSKKESFQDYVVSWADLEAVTGLEFFPTLVQQAGGRAVLEEAQRRALPGSYTSRGAGHLWRGRPSSTSSFPIQHLCQDEACVPPFSRPKSSTTTRI